jgi:hypothetical protein
LVVLLVMTTYAPFLMALNFKACHFTLFTIYNLTISLCRMLGKVMVTIAKVWVEKPRSKTFTTTTLLTAHLLQISKNSFFWAMKLSVDEKKTYSKLSVFCQLQ